MGLLSLAIWTPIAFGALLLALGRESQVQAVRWRVAVGAVTGTAPRMGLQARRARSVLPEMRHIVRGLKCTQQLA